jgi:hypothetical protein
LAQSTLEGATVILIDGLQAVADRLSRLDVGRTQADALERAARDIEAVVDVLARPPGDAGATCGHGRSTAASVGVSHRIDGHSAVIGATGSMAVTRELGTAARPPDPFLSVAARQSGPAIAERIGQMFARLMSEMRND